MRFNAYLLLLLLLAICAIPGCKPYVMSSSAVDTYPKAEQEIDFLAAVEKMPTVTNNDALHGFLLLQDGDDRATDYEARVAEGVRRRWLPAGGTHLANEAARVGWMATAGCVVMGVKGGLTMHALGPIPRYATKELVFMEILPLRTENQVLTGAEFVDYLNRLQRIAGRNRRDKPESPLGVPAGEAAISPGNEGAIQEGPLPEQGPREVGPAPEPQSAAGGTGLPAAMPESAPASSIPPSAGASPPPPAQGPGGASKPASQVPGPMRPKGVPAQPNSPPSGG